MSELPEIVDSLAGIFPFEARLASPYGALGLGAAFRLPNGTPLRIIGRLRGGGYLALFADNAWAVVPEHWVSREQGAYSGRPS